MEDQFTNEQRALGDLLRDHNAIVAVARWMTPNDFTHDAHREIYDALIRLHRRGVPADYMTVADELSRRDTLDAVGGLQYLIDLMKCEPTGMNWQAERARVEAFVLQNQAKRRESS